MLSEEARSVARCSAESLCSPLIADVAPDQTIWKTVRCNMASKLGSRIRAFARDAKLKCPRRRFRPQPKPQLAPFNANSVSVTRSAKLWRRRARCDDLSDRASSFRTHRTWTWRRRSHPPTHLLLAMHYPASRAIYPPTKSRPCRIRSTPCRTTSTIKRKATTLHQLLRQHHHSRRRSAWPKS